MDKVQMLHTSTAQEEENTRASERRNVPVEQQYRYENILYFWQNMFFVLLE